MKIGLWNDSTHFPNLCSMKISEFYKAGGHHTELYKKNKEYDLRALIQTIPNFNDYEPYAKWVQGGKPIPSNGDNL